MSEQDHLEDQEQFQEQLDEAFDCIRRATGSKNTDLFIFEFEEVDATRDQYVNSVVSLASELGLLEGRDPNELRCYLLNKEYDNG